MPKVESFRRSMIEAALAAQSWKYDTDDDGDFEVLMRYDEEAGREGVATFTFAVEGKNREIFCFKEYPNKEVEKPDWGRALLMCNKWNQGFHWPKAYLLTPDDGTSTGYLMLAWAVDFEEGIHQEFLSFLIDQLVSAAIRFSEWSFKEHGFRCTIKA